MKVYIWPELTAAPKGTGIGRIIHAQHQHLPEIGIQLVDHPRDADVIACHTQRGTAPRVDILMCHGLYFGDLAHAPYSSWHATANQHIATAAREALAVTVPSDWVAEPFRRDMRLDPFIVPHGVEVDGWDPLPNGGYVLWNKNRAGDVCDPSPALALALRGEKVVATYPPSGVEIPASMRLTGTLPWEEMRDLVRAADVYLATTHETFGVGTLEAMAAGVPILGYRWGGTADLVRHEVDGYLAAPGDQEQLVFGLEYIRRNRKALGEAARERAREFTWERAMLLYAEVFRFAAEGLDRAKRPTVAVVIPSYNYAEYLPSAVNSILAQTRPADEIVIVDDSSQDATEAVVAELQERNHGRIRYIRNEANRGVAYSRNAGIAAIKAEFIICLDADDYLDKRYIDICLREMVKSRGLGIVYTGLQLILEEGRVRKADWPPAFTWDAQTLPHVPPNNCVPSAAMFRRSMWQRAGGYMQQYAPGEDAEFWTRGLACGFEAKRITDLPLFDYRVHRKSASRTKRYVATDDHTPWIRDRRFPFAAPTGKPVEPVRSYALPVISVVVRGAIGVTLANTLDDLLGQRLREWEVIVEGKKPEGDLFEPYPFVRWAGEQPPASLARGCWTYICKSGDTLRPEAFVDALRKTAGDLRSNNLPARLQENKAMSGCCGGNGASLARAKKVLSGLDRTVSAVQTAGAMLSGDGHMRLEFIGDRNGSVTFRGKQGRTYKGGNNPLHKFVNAHPEDVDMLVGTGQWKPVMAPAVIPKPVKVAAPAPVVEVLPVPVAELAGAVSTETAAVVKAKPAAAKKSTSKKANRAA